MRNRIKIYLENRRFWRQAGFKSKLTYICAREGCSNKINNLRFILVGCECKAHAWLRSNGG